MMRLAGRGITHPVYSAVSQRCFHTLASSHSGVCAMRVGVRPCSLAHCGAPWLVAWRPCHCLITAGLATMDGPQLASADESQLCCRPSHGGTAPVDWLRGVFPGFDHLPSFYLYEAAFLWVLCFYISLQVFALRSPFRVESVSVLDRNDGSSYTFLVFGHEPSQ